jgi:Transposase IS4
MPNGRQWQQVGPKNFETQQIYDQHTRLVWPATNIKSYDQRTPLDYFLLSFPSTEWISMRRNTNIILERRHETPTTKGELVKWFGLRLIMSIEPRRRGVTSHWETEGERQEDESEQESVLTPGNFKSRFGMARNRFQDISSALRLAPDQDLTVAVAERVF